ncbi:hypothetical protein IAR50_004715 [Cryptococcus sp. DSM 104548]
MPLIPGRLTMAHWKDVSAAKIAARDAQIPEAWRIPPTDAPSVINVPRTCGVLSQKEIEITETPATALVDLMLSRQLTSYDTNCLTEIFFDTALKTAESIDTHYAQTNTPLGPLHGLPVSIKDNFYIEGVDTTVGFICWANDPATKEQESEIVKVMRECGAVLFCKTNVPTAMMIAESYNNVWGYTTNPHNTSCSSGGSSGGEAALLALRGSPLGIGTDIGGSIRIPASMCGLYSLKPSFGRFPTYGARSGLPGQEAIRSINGPLSGTLEGVELWARGVVGKKPWERDPNMVPIPWREYEVPDKLCFALVLDNGEVKPTPPVTRALQETKAALEAAGHKVIEWCPYAPTQATSLVSRFFLGDGGLKINHLLSSSGEPCPAGLLAYQARYERMKDDPPLVGDLWDLQVERTGWCKKGLEHWLKSREVTGTGRAFDAVISPVSQHSACPKMAFNDHVTYTSIWNLMDYSATTFPVGFVDPALDIKVEGYESRNEVEGRIWDRYDPEVISGAPISLQLVCQKLEEEKAIALTRVVARALKESKSRG